MPSESTGFKLKFKDLLITKEPRLYQLPHDLEFLKYVIEKSDWVFVKAERYEHESGLPDRI